MTMDGIGNPQKSKNGMKWSREETILAFDLYCHTSFGKISQTNPDIIELARLLGRTPGSVGLKMHNLAHLDPELQKRNVRAMAHGSKLDEEIFEEFSNNIMELAYQAQQIRAKLEHKELGQIIDLEDIEKMPSGEYRERMIRERIGQYYFRKSILNSYGQRCCVTGLARTELLVASHIKPWRDSDANTERTNPRNGLCLNSLHDKAFDQGLITLSEEYRIIVSGALKDAEMDCDTREWLMRYHDQEIILPNKFLPGKEFIAYHNDVIFQG